METQLPKKRVLIISHYWPPAGGGGVQRWLKFISYLPEFEWEPILVKPLGADYPNVDESLWKDVSDDLHQIGVPIWEPYSLFKWFTGRKKTEKVNTGFLFDEGKQSWKQKLAMWIRGNVLIPDPRIFWVRPVKKVLVQAIPDLQPVIIITTGPPHSIHLIGLSLSRKFNLPWIADFRDPWSKIDYLEKFKLSRLARGVQESLERKVLQQADLVLSVSGEWEKDLKALGARRTATITNGYDERDFKDYLAKKETGFRISHLGFISSFRNPTILWDAMEVFFSGLADAEGIELFLAGNVDAGVFTYLDSKEMLAQGYRYAGYLSHEDVIAAYSESSVLLLLLNNSDNAPGHIPGKLFEYLRAGKPILALGTSGGDVDRILAETGAGALFDFDDGAGILGFLQSVYHFEWVYNPNYEKIRAYERRALCGKLAENLNTLLSEKLGAK